MSERFWRRVRAYAEQRIRDHHHHERLCPNCMQWSSVATVAA